MTSQQHGATSASRQAYTRSAVDEYLAAVAARRAELEAQIQVAEARAAQADLARRRIAALEQTVGQLVVGGVARARGVVRDGLVDGTVHSVLDRDAPDFFEQLQRALAEHD